MRIVPIYLSALIFLFYFPAPAQTAQTLSEAALSEEDRKYLVRLYRDTWNFLADHVEPLTGLPYDASSKQPPTSMTNVGLYLAATSIAYRTGLISAQDAESRINQVLESLEKIEKWRGFPRPWVIVRSLNPTYGEEFNYGPHMSALIGGLLVTQATFPEIVFDGIVPRARRLLQGMELRSLYDAQTGWLKGGYHAEKKNFAVIQPWGRWYYKYFAAETRFLSYYAIVRQAVPPEHWEKLVRPVQEVEGESFFVSGYEEGGLYVQYLSGLFLDERKREMGRSQAAYAKAQMKRAAGIGAPVWGWSACLAPEGHYLGYGELRDEVVAPYASMLAALYFPEEAVANLKRLEALGARPSAHPRLGEVEYGFLDSYNWRTGASARHYLTPNQAMGFLSLANLLYDGVVWKSVEAVLPAGVSVFQL